MAGPIGQLTLRAEPSDRPQHHEGTLRVSVWCGADERARLQVPVTWRVAAAVSARPESVYVGVTEPGATVRREVLLASTEGADFTIAGATCSDAARLAGAELNDAPDPIQAVSVDLRAPDEPGPWNVDLIFDIAGSEPGRVVVPVAGMVEDGSAE